MNCPVCKSQLSVADRQGIEIDFCPTCRGVWLDRGELDKIIGRSGTQTLEHDDDDIGDRHGGRRSYETRAPYPPEERKREGFFSQLFDFD